MDPFDLGRARTEHREIEFGQDVHHELDVVTRWGGAGLGESQRLVE